MELIFKIFVHDPAFALFVGMQLISWIGIGLTTVYCIKRILQGE